MRHAVSILPFLLLACGEAPSEPAAEPETEIAAPADESAELSEDLAYLSDDGVRFVFATPEEGAEVLTRRDEYTAELQTREIGIRAMDAEATDFSAMAEIYTDDVETWAPGEEARLRAAVNEVSERIDMIDGLLPDEVLLVKTGNVVEGGLPHTRSNAIIFAGGMIPEGETLTALFLHELHHVLSRANQDLHDDYFALIGFEPCEFEEPEGLREARLTNPDAPTYKHAAPVELENGNAVIPFLHTTGAYSGEGRLPNYFGFGLLPVSMEDGVCTAVAETPEGLLDPSAVPQFLELIGGNTGYIIHPEETLADNFVFWAMDDLDHPNPEIINAVGGFWEAAAQ